MAVYYLYILKSQRINRFYIGSTSDITKRLEKHNSGLVRSTKGYYPWTLIHKEVFLEKKSARQREIHLKKNYQARKEILNRYMVLSSNG